MGEGEQLHFRCEQVVEPVERQPALGVDGDEAQFQVEPLGEELPGDEIRVVLHFGEQDHVARAQELSAPRLRDKVDALGRPAREDDFLRQRRAEIAGDLRARGLVSPVARELSSCRPRWTLALSCS